MSSVVVTNPQQIGVALSSNNTTSVSLNAIQETSVELTQENSYSISLSMVPFIPAPKSQLYVQNEQPEIPVGTQGLWVQTGLGQDGNGFTFWIEDGQ